MSAASHPALEHHYCVAEVAKMLNLSRQTVTRLFQDRDDVFKIPNKRGNYVTLRIPESTLMKVYQERSRGFRLEIQPRRSPVK